MSNDIVQKLRPKRQALFELVQVWLLELGIRSEITAQEFLCILKVNRDDMVKASGLPDEGGCYTDVVKALRKTWPKGHWCGGIECYMRTYRCWVPRWITIDRDVDDYVEKHSDNEKGFWL